MENVTDVRIALGVDEIKRYDDRASFRDDFGKSYDQNFRWRRSLCLQGWLHVVPKELVSALGDPLFGKTAGARRME